ncbi:MAG: hypothetical protein WCI72_06865 [archaeon]
MGELNVNFKKINSLAKKKIHDREKKVDKEHAESNKTEQKGLF